MDESQGEVDKVDGGVKRGKTPAPATPHLAVLTRRSPA
jgi:hypothetical protein